MKMPIVIAYTNNCRLKLPLAGVESLEKMLVALLIANADEVSSNAERLTAAARTFQMNFLGGKDNAESLPRSLAYRRLGAAYGFKAS